MALNIMCRLLILLLLFCLFKGSSANNGTGNVTSANSTTAIPIIMTTSVAATTPVKPATSVWYITSTTLAPTATVTTVVIPTATVVPTATVIPTTSTKTTVPPTTSVITPTGCSKDCHTCEEALKSERRYKWAAVSFDIIFAFALVVMTVLYLRQRKMYREMEGDGSLSRLI